MSQDIWSAVLKGLQYIEDNLQKTIGVSDVADASAYSQFYFAREFSRLTHISVYDYIQRRKLSESYRELFKTRGKIVDLAFRYGFQSHEVFTRAFRKMFGENPSEAKVCKPLLLFDPIGEDYLEFLSGLRMEYLSAEVPACRFAVHGTAQSFPVNTDEDILVLFAPDNQYACSCILRGQLQETADHVLSFLFNCLRHQLRIYSTDLPHIARFYFNTVYDAAVASGNYLILKTETAHTDILLPD